MKKWHVGWGPIEECNMTCEFCYSHAARASKSEVGYDDWISFIDNNHEHISDINYGTGENTLSKDWFRLIDYIRTAYPEITQALTTNGYLIEQVSNDKALEKIVLKSIDEIDVSLDYADGEKYGRFRGNSNVFRWATGTLAFCQQHNIPSTIVFIGAKPILEKDNIDGIFKIAKQYDAKLRMNIYRPTNPSAETNNKFIAPFKQIIDILYHIDSKYKVLTISDPLFSSILTADNFEPDPSGSNSVRILHNGMVTPSTYLISEDFQRYNIKNGNIFEQIEADGGFSDFSHVPEACASCKFGETCKGGVFDRRYLWYKDFSERDPYCPFKEDNFLPEKLVVIHKDETFSSVHDGYLPTLFFIN